MKINNINKRKMNFTKCSNAECNAIILCDENDVIKNEELFCDSCSKEVLHSHIVQCKNCQTIIYFIPAFAGEEQMVYNVPKCSFCSGSEKDDDILTPVHFRDSFM